MIKTRSSYRPGNRPGPVAVILVCVAAAFPALALDIDEFVVARDGSSYTVNMWFEVAAPVDRVIEALTDYENPDRLSPEVTHREIVGEGDGYVRVLTEIHDCVLLFCKDIRMTQDVRVEDDTIQADIVPDGSDFRHGRLRWVVKSEDGGRSRVRFEATMEPDFFVPPLIGGYLVGRMLRRSIVATAEKLESEAAPGPPRR